MEQNLENAETENENVERGSNFDIFLNISMYVKTHFVPIIPAKFQTAEDLFTIASNTTSDLASSTTSNLASSNGRKSVEHDFEPVEVTIETDDEEGGEEDVEHDLEPDEPEESEEISEAVEDLEPDEPNVDQDREEDKNEAILDDIISVLASQEQEVSEDASEEEEATDATSEASDEPTDEDIDTNAEADVISDKFSPTPRRPSPYTPSQYKYKGRGKKPSKYQNEGESRAEDNFVKEDTHTFQAHTPKIILPKSKSRLGTEKSEMKYGSIAIKPYKPTDVLIRSLKEINYDQLEKGEYSIADLKHFATLLNIGATEKIEDLQQQILDILQQYVEE